MATVLHRGRIYTPAGPAVTAMVVDGATVTWLGTDDAVAPHLGPGDTVVDLAGALVTPAFVDAHVHATATGLALTGLDLRGHDGGQPDRSTAWPRSYRTFRRVRGRARVRLGRQRLGRSHACPRPRN